MQTDRQFKSLILPLSPRLLVTLVGKLSIPCQLAIQQAATGMSWLEKFNADQDIV
jgi:hypothetical protein